MSEQREAMHRDRPAGHFGDENNEVERNAYHEIHLKVIQSVISQTI